jgi:hypothetical protein
MDISTEIWKLFGKDKRRYVERDILSDESDMEADTRTLEREEKFRSVHFAHVLVFLSVDRISVCALPRKRRKRPWRKNDDMRKRSAVAGRSGSRGDSRLIRDPLIFTLTMDKRPHLSINTSFHNYCSSYHAFL